MMIPQEEKDGRALLRTLAELGWRQATNYQVQAEMGWLQIRAEKALLWLAMQKLAVFNFEDEVWFFEIAPVVWLAVEIQTDPSGKVVGNVQVFDNEDAASECLEHVRKRSSVVYTQTLKLARAQVQRKFNPEI